MTRHHKPVAKTRNQSGADVLVTENPAETFPNSRFLAYCNGCTQEKTGNKPNALAWTESHANSCTLTRV